MGGSLFWRVLRESNLDAAMIAVQAFLGLGSPALDLDVTLLIQTALFVLLFVVVNYVLVKPYLKARDGREALTVGAREESKALDAESLALDAVYASSRQLALGEVEASRRKVIAQAKEEAQAIIDESRARVGAELKAKSERDLQDIHTARKESAQTVKLLGAEICQKLCGESGR